MDNYLIENSGTECRVRLQGDLTASQVPELQIALKKRLQENVGEVVFDLEKTTMLDSTGIGLLIAASNSLKRRQEQGGAPGLVRVANASPDIIQLLQSMRLVSRLNVTGRNGGE